MCTKYFKYINSFTTSNTQISMNNQSNITHEIQSLNLEKYLGLSSVRGGVKEEQDIKSVGEWSDYKSK